MGNRNRSQITDYRSLIALVFILIFILSSAYYFLREAENVRRWELHSRTPVFWGTAVVLGIHDGDTITIKIASKTFRARLIGIDAPEMGQRPWGERSKRALERMVNPGSRVLIETDIEKFDKYNRLLIYLFNEEGVFINEQMLLEGYAVLFTFPPNVKYVGRLIEAEKKARKQKRGIWSRNGLKERPIEYKEKHRDQWR